MFGTLPWNDFSIAKFKLLHLVTKPARIKGLIRVLQVAIVMDYSKEREKTLDHIRLSFTLLINSHVP